MEEENKDDNKKFNNMVKAIRKNVDVPGYSKIIWIVSKLFWLENISQVFQDEKKQQWKKETSVHWFLKHRISTNEIQLRMNEGGKEIINENIKVEKQIIFLNFLIILQQENLSGGRLGVFCMSQEKVTWSALELACPLRHFM